MKDRISDFFTYYPVGPVSNKMAGILCTSYFANVTAPVPSGFLKYLEKKKSVGTDSGGFQIFKSMIKGKVVMVGSIFKTKINDPDLFILGVIDNCEEYARMHSSIAMCIDFPTNTDDSDAAYWWKLSQSLKARDQMLSLAKYLCSKTKLGIALQPRNPMEIKSYYCFIYTPEVQIYAYPIRDFRNKPKDAPGNAYVLSFLSSVGIRHVHFLGSNAPPVIFVLAQAISLKMFDKLSLDSLTWNQPAVSRSYKYLCHDTLDAIPNKKGKSLNPYDNAKDILPKYSDMIEEIHGPTHFSKYPNVKEWLGIYNIWVIEHFKDMVLSAASNNDLRYLIKNFPKYGEKGKDKIIKALDLLEDSKDYGHEHIENQYGSMIE